ncbi:ankyrin [Trematosphaeria pertusa]|uniref:Ankyrin n=1 Tax=Trematosphaeria pertusa TaxID=390896 RepID=A0A6A6IUV5_9PLEO|nr:ankyrin [Trematosphaeria pertusa]KAF2254341.1 ankyrin [Trematosphaeria pertusa]
MALPQASCEHLIALCQAKTHEQLLCELQQSATAQIALSEEVIMVMPGEDREIKQLNLQRMLEAAAYAGRADTVECLLDFGQQYGVAVPHLLTPWAKWWTLSSANALEVLLKFRALDADVFVRAFRTGPVRVQIISFACTGGPNSEDPPCKAFLPLVRHLMKIGCDPNTPIWRFEDHPGYLLYRACWTACYEVVECLLQHGVLVKGSRAARPAARDGRVDVLELLLRYGADMNECFPGKDLTEPQGTALHAAVASNQTATVEWLLQHGADAGIRNVDGKTTADYIPEDADEALRTLMGGG